MMETVTEPLVPADVDLTGLPWMPFYGHRLFGSDFNATDDDTAWRAGVTLWWAAWNQVPATSLADDDKILARAAGFGRDIKGWQKVRDAAMHGFVKCTSDGRLYHKALAPIALEAWKKRVDERNRKRKWREGRDALPARDGDAPETGTSAGTGRGQDAGQTGDKVGDGTRTGHVASALRGEDRRRQDTSPLPPEAGRGHAANGTAPPEVSRPSNGHAKPPPAEVDDGLEIVRSFHRLREEIWGIAMPADTALTAKEISVANAWVEDGVEYYPALDFMGRRMTEMRSRGQLPPERPQFFDKQIREAMQADWPGFKP